jgi:protein TonB
LREQKPEAVVTLEKMTSSHAQFPGRVEWPAHSHERAARESSNIILFSRSRGGSAAPAIVLGPDDRPAPFIPERDSRASLAAFSICAFALHAGLYALERTPVPLASIGEVSVSVDIVLGSQADAGLASTPGSTMASPEAKENQQSARTGTAEPTEAPARPESAMREPESKSQIEPEPLTQAPVTVESPTGSLAPRPPVIERKRRDKAREPRAKPQREAGRQAAESERPAPSSMASTPSGGLGRGRSDADSNYPALVAAHLARHKQDLADASPRDDRGVSHVMISVDGNGRVTGIRLTRSSGLPSLDQEAQAIVRRASPLPPPPSGKPMSLSWSLRLGVH